MGLDLYEQAKKFCQDGLAIDKNNAELKSLYAFCFLLVFAFRHFSMRAHLLAQALICFFL